MSCSKSVFRSLCSLSLTAFLLLGLGCKSEPKKAIKYSILLEKMGSAQHNLIKNKMTGSNQVIIYKDGEAIYDSIVNSGLTGDADITDKTIFPIWSMSKPITTVAAMILFEEGKFAMEDPIEKFLPEMENLQCLDEEGNSYPCKKSVTVFDLLAHQSGWGYYPFDDQGNRILIRDLHFEDLEDFSKTIAGKPLQFEPGARYQYGVNTSILGRLIEVISGQTFYVFLKERVLDPLEMENTKFYLTASERDLVQPLFRKDDSGFGFYLGGHDELSYNKESKTQLGGAGLVSTTEDYAHFCQMLLDNGVYKGQKLLDSASIKMMTSVINPELNRGTFIGFSTGFSMFNLTDTERDATGSPSGIFGWGGYHGTLFWIDQTNNLYGLVMTRNSLPARETFRTVRKAAYQGIQ